MMASSIARNRVRCVGGHDFCFRYSMTISGAGQENVKNAANLKPGPATDQYPASFIHRTPVINRFGIKADREADVNQIQDRHAPTCVRRPEMIGAQMEHRHRHENHPQLQDFGPDKRPAADVARLLAEMITPPDSTASPRSPTTHRPGAAASGNPAPSTNKVSATFKSVAISAVILMTSSKFTAFSYFFQHQARITPAKTRVQIDRHPHRIGPRFARHIIQIASGIGLLQVDRRRNFLRARSSARKSPSQSLPRPPSDGPSPAWSR